MSIERRDPFVGLRVPDPPERLAEAIHGPPRRPRSVRRHLTDHLWENPWLRWAWGAACVLVLTANLLLARSQAPSHASLPAPSQAALALAPEQPTRPTDAPDTTGRNAGARLSALDRQELLELGLTSSGSWGSRS